MNEDVRDRACAALMVRRRKTSMRNRGLSICRSRGRLPLAPSEGRRGRWRMLKAGRRREKCRDSVRVRVDVLLGPLALVECRKRMRGMCCQCGRCPHAACAPVPRHFSLQPCLLQAGQQRQWCDMQ